MESKVTRIRIDLLEKLAEKNVNINDFVERALTEPKVDNASEKVSATTEDVISTIPKCPKCGEIASKDGRVTHRDGIHQRWICRTGCGYKFLDGIIRVFPKKPE